MSETRNDIENVAAWAEVIRAPLHLMPTGCRAAVLALAARNEGVARKEAETTGGWIKIDLTKPPDFSHWHAVMRLKSLVVQVFVRTIKTNHHPAKAAKLLYAHHKWGYGSRLLQDYLPPPA
jgi:hypothetical protein